MGPSAATPAADIDAVIRDLDVVIDDARASACRLGFFASLYRGMTAAVKQGVEDGSFDDGTRMSRLAGAFAARYFDALGAWRGGEVPTRSWRVAFETAGREDRLILQHLLLGVNAHINLDLAVAAAELAPGAAIGDLQDDFLRISDTIERLLDPVQEVVGRFSPLLGTLDLVGGRTDEHVLNFSLEVARGDAWRQAVVLAQLDESQRGEAVFLTDRRVAFLGGILKDPGGRLGPAVDVIRFAESDDVRAVIDGLRAIDPPKPRREVTASGVLPPAGV